VLRQFAVHSIKAETTRSGVSKFASNSECPQFETVAG